MAPTPVEKLEEVTATNERDTSVCSIRNLGKDPHLGVLTNLGPEYEQIHVGDRMFRVYKSELPWEAASNAAESLQLYVGHFLEQ